jgi:hypothetical protein
MKCPAKNTLRAIISLKNLPNIIMRLSTFSASCCNPLPAVFGLKVYPNVADDISCPIRSSALSCSGTNCLRAKRCMIPSFTLTLPTQTGKNCCARVIVPPVAGRACSPRTGSHVRSNPVPACARSASGGLTPTRFSSAWVCNVRVYSRLQENQRAESL